MARIIVALLLLVWLGGNAAHAASTFSGLPAASQPLGNVPTYVPMDQGTDCTVTNPVACTTVQSDALRLGQPIQATCASILSPFQYQQCIDTSLSPPQIKEYIGSTWWALSSLSPSTGPVVVQPSSLLTSPFTLGATSVTTSGTQFNYLNAAVGTTGSLSSNLMFSSGPTFSNPTITGTVTANGTPFLNDAANFVSGAQRVMSTTGSDAVFVIGSTGLPNTGSGFAPVIGEVIGGSATIGSITPAVYGMGIKAAGQNGNSVHVNGGYFGAEDESGWSGSVGAANNNFIEGVRAEGLLNTGATLGTAFGAVDVASTKNGVTYLFLIANESEVDNNSGSDAANGFNPSQFSGSYLASNDGANIADAAFIVNPFNPIGYRRGFFVPREAGGAAASLTTSAQFEGQAHSTWGLQLESAIITNAIGIPNNAPIRGANLAGNADYNLLYVGTDNSLHLGNDAGLAGTSVGRGNVLTLPGSGNATLSNGLTVGTFVTLAGAAAVAGASQISLGNAVAAPNTGSCPNAVTGCWVINVAGTARYVPFY